MSRSGDVELRFGPERHTFRLSIGPMRRVQEKCDAGPMELQRRCQEGTWRIDDVREPILQGLIGGGMKPGDAGDLVETWFDQRPFGENVPIAFAILAASIVGVEDERLGEAAAGEEGADPSLATSSGSPSSTE